MPNQNQTIKYVMYCRKSSESEERQVQSIDDQRTHLVKLAQDRLQLNYNPKMYIESKSAKEPHIRPVFDEMMTSIERGEANAILCWQINRLSRNPIDSARIAWLLQQGKLQAIQTPDRVYLPGDNVLLFNIESGVANQFILDLSKNVRRGINSKLEKGWRPGMASTGYRNKLEDHTIIPDSKRFKILRKAWDLMLSGNYNVPAILNILNNEWGFRSIKRKKTGDKPLALSALYKIFTNPFYMGIIVHNGKEYKGKHKPMVTEDEFECVQGLLKAKGKSRFKKHIFAYTGFMKCGECGSGITAETKSKYIKATKKIKDFTYYRCTKKKPGIKCKQKPVTLDMLESQLDKELEKYTILPQFKDWALEILNRENDSVIETRQKIFKNQQQTLSKLENEQDNLTKMRYREQITDEEYMSQRQEIQQNIKTLRKQIKSTEHRTDNWREIAEKIFDFATNARKSFQNGAPNKKREIALQLGSNYVLRDKELLIQAHKYLIPIKKSYPTLEHDYLRLELKKSKENADNKHINRSLDPLINNWQGC